VLAIGTPEELKKQCRTPEHPSPTMEDTFIDLIQNFEKKQGQA